MLKPGQEAYVVTGGIRERVVVVREMEASRHPCLKRSFFYPSRKVVITRGKNTPNEIVRLDELRFG